MVGRVGWGVVWVGRGEVIVGGVVDKWWDEGFDWGWWGRCLDER